MVSLCFAAGCFGGVAGTLALWLSGKAGLSQALGVTFIPRLTGAFMYPVIIWAGICGLFFLIPLCRSYLLRGLAFSLGPIAILMFVIFPYHLKMGVGGVKFGNWTPLIIVLVNVIWGLSAAIWLKIVDEK